jgi:hypothetical protein
MKQNARKEKEEISTGQLKSEFDTQERAGEKQIGAHKAPSSFF